MSSFLFEHANLFDGVREERLVDHHVLVEDNNRLVVDTGMNYLGWPF